MVPPLSNHPQFRICLVGHVIWLTALASAHAQSQPAHSAVSASRVSCALIIDGSLRAEPITALVEQSLLQRSELRLVERQEVDRVLAEQTLQLGFGAAEGANRSRLGSLLHADLLVLLRMGALAQNKVVDVVICETTAGLRLRVQSFPWSGADTALTDQITALVMQALDKHKEQVRRIIAIPPFKSGDFLHDRDYLQQKFSRIAEELLITWPNTIVVELDEARAIGGERQLTSSSPAAQRGLPFYLIGEYRHDGKDDEERIGIELTLRQGNQELKQKRSQKLKPSEAVAFLRSAITEMVTDSHDNINKASPEEEARQLLARADVFMKTSNWAEALNLVEAAILLEPDRADLHEKAYDLTTHRQRQLDPGHLDKNGRPPVPADEYLLRAILSQECFQANIEHNLRWMELTSFSNRKVPTGFRWLKPAYGNWWDRWKIPVIQGTAYVELQHRQKAIENSFREGAFQILERKTRANDISETHLAYFADATGASADQGDKLRFIRVIQNVPDAERAIIESFITCMSWSGDIIKGTNRINWKTDWLDSPSKGEELLRPETKQILKELEQLPGESAQKAAALLRQGLALAPQIREKWAKKWGKSKQDRAQEDLNYAERSANWAKSTQPSSDSSPEISLEPIELNAPAEGADGWNGTIIGWQHCQKGVDAILTVDRIFLMTQPSHLKLAYRARQQDFWDYSNQHRPYMWFDGRYLWVPAAYAKEPYVIALEPSSGKYTILSSATGLPPTHFGLNVAPYGIGKACLSAAFGGPGNSTADRSWIALITLADAGPPIIDVILEASANARIDPSPLSEGREDVKVAFIPLLLVPLANPTRPEDCQLLLFRDRIGAQGNSSLPLQINPSSRNVTLPKGAEPLLPGKQPRLTCIHDGILDILFEYKVKSIGFPDFEVISRPLLLGVGGTWQGAPSTLAILSGSYHTVSGGAWWAGALGEPLRKLKGDLPEGLWMFADIRESHHYGQVILAGPNETWLQPFQVKIVPSIISWAHDQVFEAQGRSLSYMEEAKMRDAALRANSNESAEPLWWVFLSDRMMYSIAIVVAVMAAVAMLIFRKLCRTKTTA